MHKLIVIGGIGLVLAVILAVWAFVAGVGLISEKLPHWISGAEKAGTAALGKAREALPLIEGKAGEFSPEIAGAFAGALKSVSPVEKIPAADVGGEDIAGVPRFPGMVRVSFKVLDGMRTVGYKGRAELAAAVDFYGREMSALGFKKAVKSASAGDEVHEYSKAGRMLGFSFKRTASVGVVTTEIIISELWTPGK